jgi:hypothetical protein
MLPNSALSDTIPDKGKWRTFDCKFVNSKSLTNWGILDLVGIDEYGLNVRSTSSYELLFKEMNYLSMLQGFNDRLIQDGIKNGMNMSAPAKILKARKHEMAQKFQVCLFK